MDETPSWLSALDEDELIAMVRRPDLAAKPESARDNGLLLGIALSRADPKESIDKLGNGLLPIAIDGHVSYFGWPDYWQRLKDELKIIVCTSLKPRSLPPLRQRWLPSLASLPVCSFRLSRCALSC
jgi:hypothetical protein